MIKAGIITLSLTMATAIPLAAKADTPGTPCRRVCTHITYGNGPSDPKISSKTVCTNCPSPLGSAYNPPASAAPTAPVCVVRRRGMTDQTGVRTGSGTCVPANRPTPSRPKLAR